jgi:cysteine-rich repeat protein
MQIIRHLGAFAFVLSMSCGKVSEPPTLQPTCGDSILQAPNEECDDGNETTTASASGANDPAFPCGANLVGPPRLRRRFN